MRQRNRGFTIIELLVAISVVAVLTSMAAPAMGSFVTSVRLSSASNQLFGDFNLARAEAIKRNRRVLVCPSNSDGTSCATGTNWATGWRLCVDADSDGTCDTITDTSDPNYPNPFGVRPPLVSNIAMVSTINTIVFKPDGSATDAVLTMSSSSSSKTVSVVKTGFISKS